MKHERESRKAPPDMKTGRSLRTCLSRGVPADHEAQSQVKEEEEAAAGVKALKGSLTQQKNGRKTRSDIAEFTIVGTPACKRETRVFARLEDSQQCQTNQGTTQWRMCVNT